MLETFGRRWIKINVDITISEGNSQIRLGTIAWNKEGWTINIRATSDSVEDSKIKAILNWIEMARDLKARNIIVESDVVNIIHHLNNSKDPWPWKIRNYLSNCLGQSFEFDQCVFKYIKRETNFETHNLAISTSRYLIDVLPSTLGTPLVNWKFLLPKTKRNWVTKEATLNCQVIVSNLIIGKEPKNNINFPVGRKWTCLCYYQVERNVIFVLVSFWIKR